ncbi:Ab-hydrolase associated lipase region protein (macronuclear) [Tetrahymena thermophila SB210]|uniref:Lipase n=1 Tax=Tetrahymena thermophila (strain SB210) TaxID=312017 RepID=Q22LP7_TETTS|nr:Ab-hydrolase associated lipase region protein [Tetrahymena thermophila SB210]EAR86219.1 Ab-hydrolase associated lipase region protein [Tetrahymena thermophila SB210]|eukprot:XP_976814.1 Ab-hydrolase associated lipase region protein [Tetrahymena thermophila SB210]
MKLQASLFIFTLLLLSQVQSQQLSDDDIKELANDSFVQICQKYNYPVEIHKITTQDGYILTYYRIQRPGTTIVSNLPVVYLQHGLVDSSFDFIINEVTKAPGFILANQGFDVWMGNSRGNDQSLEHISLNWQTDPEYWNFSWQEMSKYDLPAAFSYIANVTQAEKIDYIGHSQGTSIMFASLSEKDPIVSKYLGKFIAMGPVAYVNHSDAMFIDLIKKVKLTALLRKFNINYVMMPNQKVNSFVQLVCAYFPSFCGLFDQALANFDPKTDNLERFKVILGHYPTSTSSRTIEHWQQMLNNKKDASMKKFDYGLIGNLKKYGSIHAPEYDISSITQKVYLVAGAYDRIADITDATLLHNKLQNSEMYVIEGGHGTFMWARDISYFYQIVTPILHNKTPLVPPASS